MGKYIQNPDGSPHGKDHYLQSLGGVECSREEARKILADTDSTKAIVIYVNNGPFDAAAYAYNSRELEAFIGNSSDPRPMKIFKLDKEIVVKLAA